MLRRLRCLRVAAALAFPGEASPVAATGDIGAPATTATICLASEWAPMGVGYGACWRWILARTAGSYLLLNARGAGRFAQALAARFRFWPHRRNRPDDRQKHAKARIA